MKRDRITDRVHVVKEPETLDDAGEILPSAALPASLQTGRGMEIVRTLAQISDRLKRSEAERYELLAELREYRKSLNELEDKAEKSEKAYLTLENKIKGRDSSEVEITQRQARFERALKDAESKLVQAAAGQNILDTRLKDMETFQTVVNQRLDETVVQQARLDRQYDKINQDKQRTIRKVERMEEILSETQDALKARALVLLTDQDNAAKAAGHPQIAAYNPDAPEDRLPWWKRPSIMQGVGLGSLVVAALMFGWALNQMQKPEVPLFAVTENGGLATLNEQNRWEPVAATATNAPAPDNNAPSSDAASPDQPVLPVSGEPTAEGSPTQTPSAQAALNASDEQLLSALEENSDALAAQLNEIAPEARQELDDVTPSTASPRAPSSQETARPSGYNPLKQFEATAFTQDPATAQKIAAETGGSALSDRIPADTAVSGDVKALEEQAFGNDGQAQHDLAAIYTAGRGGVAQDFGKAAAWFREAAGNGVPNAAYNLGVLYHQGLGVNKDLATAMYWYKEAAKKGHAEAQYNLGIANIEGIGTPYDAPLAAAFFESAANQGVVEAAYNLGLIYENGLIGGAPKPEEALMWYKVAANGGNADATSALTQLASSMQIDMDKVDALAERMQSVYASEKGRRAGGEKKAANS